MIIGHFSGKSCGSNLIPSRLDPGLFGDPGVCGGLPPDGLLAGADGGVAGQVGAAGVAAGGGVGDQDGAGDCGGDGAGPGGEQRPGTAAGLDKQQEQKRLPQLHHKLSRRAAAN